MAKSAPVKAPSIKNVLPDNSGNTVIPAFANSGTRKKGKRISLAPVYKFQELEKIRLKLPKDGNGEQILSMINAKFLGAKHTAAEFKIEGSKEKKKGMILLFEVNGEEIGLPAATGLVMALKVKESDATSEYQGKMFNLDFKGSVPSKRGNDAWVIDVELIPE